MITGFNSWDIRIAVRTECPRCGYKYTYDKTFHYSKNDNLNEISELQIQCQRCNERWRQEFEINSQVICTIR